jgi:hypothetical protein
MYPAQAGINVFRPQSPGIEDEFSWPSAQAGRSIFFTMRPDRTKIEPLVETQAKVVDGR